MLAIPPFWASSKNALLRANTKPPVELVVADLENGYSVINPAKVNAMLPEDATWEEYIKVSLTLLSICTGVYMMPGWRESRGAVLEFMQARRNEMQIYEDIPRKLQNGIIKWDGGRCGKEPGDVKRD